MILSGVVAANLPLHEVRVGDIENFWWILFEVWYNLIKGGYKAMAQSTTFPGEKGIGLCDAYELMVGSIPCVSPMARGFDLRRECTSGIVVDE